MYDHVAQAKLAKLRRELLEPGSGSGAGGGGKGEGFDVNKVGDARVGLVGMLPGRSHSSSPLSGVACVHWRRWMGPYYSCSYGWMRVSTQSFEPWHGL